MLVTILVFIALLGLLVFIHELGHFLMAKRAGVRVEEFAFGFKPRIWGKKFGETTYAINLIPLGGYVKMYGEGEGEEPVADLDRSYKSKTIAQRFSILVAGAAMNLLFGWLILTILFTVGFDPLMPDVGKNPFVSKMQDITVAGVVPNSPAAQAEITSGTEIISINGARVATITEFLMKIDQLRGETVSLGLRTEGVEQTVSVLARDNPPTGEGSLGILVSSEGEVGSTVLAAPAAGLYETGRIIGLSAQGFVYFLGDLFVKQEVSEDVTGLIGIGAATGIVRRLGFEYLMQLAMLVSIGLGVVNLMPIMPLDGGHIALLGYEKLRGRPMSERKMNWFAMAGLALVGLIFVVVTYKDVIRFNIIDRIF